MKPANTSVNYEERAASALEELSLTTARDALDTGAQRASAEAWSYSHFLGYLLDAEVTERRRRAVAMNLRLAKLPYIKRLADFNFSAQPSIDKRLIDELATGRFLHEGRNLVLLGPPGVGKTHLAIALAVLSAELGCRVSFTTAIDLARRLASAMAENRLHRELKTLTRPTLLVIDEVGYLQLDPTQASLLFQVISKRYEANHSIVLTSNKAFSDWSHVFAADPIMASAALDRLLHRATVINIKGDSFRLKERRKAASTAV